MSTKQKTIAKKRMIITTEPVTPAEPEDDLALSPQRQTWTQLFTCTPPRCDGGDNNADYFISSSGRQGDGEEPEDESGYREEKKDEEDIGLETVFALDGDEGSTAPATAPVKIFWTEESETASLTAAKHMTSAGMRPQAKGEQAVTSVPPKVAPVASNRCKSCAIM